MMRAYHLLIEKITAKMKHWTSKLLSYAGRVQLIISIATYLQNIFLIPKKVLKHVEGLCRSFLWSVKEIVIKKPL